MLKIQNILDRANPEEIKGRLVCFRDSKEIKEQLHQVFLKSGDIGQIFNYLHNASLRRKDPIFWRYIDAIVASKKTVYLIKVVDRFSSLFTKEETIRLLNVIHQCKPINYHSSILTKRTLERYSYIEQKYSKYIV